MKSIVNVFWISLLLGCNICLAQEDKMFKSLEEALSVPADSVYRLDLSRNKLTAIPAEIYRFTNLRELDLSKNKLASLPKEFHFKDLRILHLTKNKFEEFPEAVCQNTSLRNLFMGKNNIKIIPDCISNLKDLIVFDIWFNPIEELPESLTQLRNLRSLDLSGITFTKEQQEKWAKMLHWVKIEFEPACKCN
ncbi:MAG: leucine-rich repeat domain-containing protein [Crocinitomicaceae bacterium]|nr:leucine-rich repeat domain-containing protein [Crocinitomicaceae bacterium]